MFTKRHVLKGNWKGVLGGIQIQVISCFFECGFLWMFSICVNTFMICVLLFSYIILQQKVCLFIYFEASWPLFHINVK